MKLCHPIALALMGWYLMLLPKTGPGQAGVLPPDWTAIQYSFDTAKECEQARAEAVVPPAPAKAGQAAQPLLGKPVSESPQAFYCVASDDPRLK